MVARSAALLLLGMALAGCGGHSGAPPTQESGSQTAGPFTVQLRTEPDPPRAGVDTHFRLSVQADSGPVAGASISLQLVNKSSNTQGPMVLAQDTPGWAGRYDSQSVTIGLAGIWAAEVTVRDARRGTATATFPFTVR